MRTAIFKWHHRAAWIAGIAALLWGLSGLSHPVMVWLSPRPAVFAPPAWSIDLDSALPLDEIMTGADIGSASEARIVSDGTRTALLLRAGEHDPRRYFDLKSGAEIPDGDRIRAIALARHYTKHADAAVRSARYLTAHTKDYPPNNSLLPVWQITFDTDDALTVYVDTGSGRLATIDNNVRNRIIAFFSNVHTLAFLPMEAEWARVLIITIMVGSIAATATLGLGLLVFLKNRSKRRGGRKWHRLLAYAAVIPALTFSTSGLYHLLFNASLTNNDAQKISPAPFTPEDLAFGSDRIATHMHESRTPVGATVIRGPQALPLLRVSFADRPKPAPSHDDPHAHHGVSHPAGHDAQDESPNVIWLHAPTGQTFKDGAKAVARAIAINAAAIEPGSIRSITPVAGFTDEYGFINKRLPVWRVATDSPGNPRYFIDTVDGVISARVTDYALFEGKVFSTLHKWRFMDWIGQTNRDILIMFFVSLIILTACLGWTVQIMRFRTNGKKQHHKP